MTELTVEQRLDRLEKRNEIDLDEFVDKVYAKINQRIRQGLGTIDHDVRIVECKK